MAVADMPEVLIPRKAKISLQMSMKWRSSKVTLLWHFWTKVSLFFHRVILVSTELQDITNFAIFLLAVNHVTEVRHERGRKLWFDVSEVAKDSTLMMAELRIFQNPALGRWQDINKEFIITVYSVTNGEEWVYIVRYSDATQ